MASSSNTPNTIGLNEISILDVNLTDQDNTIPTNYHRFFAPMNSTKRNEGGNGGGGGGLSRIPKLTFSFRRPKSATSSQENSPAHSKKSHLARPSSKDSGAKSLPNSNESSPTLSRSKSLRLPRSYAVKSLSSSHLRDKDQVLDEGDDFFPDDDRSSYARSDSKSSFTRGRSSTFSVSGSNKKGARSRSGRSVSPGSGLTKSGGNHYQHSQADDVSVCTCV